MKLHNLKVFITYLLCQILWKPQLLRLWCLHGSFDSSCPLDLLIHKVTVHNKKLSEIWFGLCNFFYSAIYKNLTVSLHQFFFVISLKILAIWRLIMLRVVIGGLVQKLTTGDMMGWELVTKFGCFSSSSLEN